MSARVSVCVCVEAVGATACEEVHCQRQPVLLFDTSEQAARSALSSAVSLGVTVCGRSLVSGLGRIVRVLKRKKKKGVEAN